METENNESNNLTDDQMDALIEGEGSSSDIPMSEEGQEPTQEQIQEYTLKVGGKEIKAPLDKVLQWAQMGYNYPQKAQELNAQQQKWAEERAQWENKIKEYESKWTPYKEVDEFASKNPDWWARVQEAYKQQIAQSESNPEIAKLKEELQEIKNFKQEILSKEESQARAKEDEMLSSEIESIRKQYPNIDFDTPDENGETLEMKVLKHGIENDIKSFKTAYRDYYHEHLVNRAREEGKEVVAKEVQKRTKLGILGESSKPTKGLKVAQNVKAKSYNDLVREALDELHN